MPASKFVAQSEGASLADARRCRYLWGTSIARVQDEGARLRLLQIVPRLRPAHDGIGEHALRLAEKLQSIHGIQPSFLVCDPFWSGPDQIGGFPVSALANRSQEALITELKRFLAPSEPGAILLQFASYGYEKRGIPFWLVNGITRLRRENRFQFLSMFHELNAARGAPWSSTFWLSRVQRWLIGRLVGLSDVILTNAAYHQHRLKQWGAGNVLLLPSFSTIGEPTVEIPWSRRKRQIIVFGRPSHRRLSYDEGLEALRRACTFIDAENIIDIGAPLDLTSISASLGIPIISCGQIADAEVEELMQQSQASFLYYPEALLTKSSVFGATCATGAIPFVASQVDASLDSSELDKGLDYIKLDSTGLPSDPLNLEEMSSLIYARYQLRSSRAAAQLIADQLSPKVPTDKHQETLRY